MVGAPDLPGPRHEPEHEQSWKRYAGSLIVFSAVSLLITYLIMRIQGSLPLNPQHLGAVAPALSWNTAVSFITNTNWQNYAGETTMSYFTQMAALTVQQFVSAAVGIAVASLSSVASLAGIPDDRQLLGGRHALLPLRPVAIAFVGGSSSWGRGLCRLSAVLSTYTTLERRDPDHRRRTVGFMEAIKELGTNGGALLQRQRGAPLENPTGVTNLLSFVLLLCIPFALTYTFGKMVRSIRQGAALLAAMVIIFGCWVGFSSYAEHQGNPQSPPRASRASPQATWKAKRSIRRHPVGPLRHRVDPDFDGQRRRANDSYTAMGGFGLLTGMMLGEVTPGGTGSGIYTILLYASSPCSSVA